MKIIDARHLPSFEINPVVEGTAVLDDEWKETNVKSPFSRLYYIKKGTAYILCNGKEYRVTAGNVCLIPAETEFSYKGVSYDVIEKRFFHISIPTTEHFDLLSGINGIYVISIKEAKAEQIFDLQAKNNYAYLMELKSIIYSTVVAFVKRYNFCDILIGEYSGTVKQAMEYIQRNLKASLTLKEISDAVFISESNLRKQFRLELGTSVGRYIDSLILNKAKSMLIHKNYSIKKISDELGYGEQFYFARRFKEMTGKTPSQYRRENKDFML